MYEFHPVNPHDHFVRRTFDVVDHAKVLLVSLLPAALLTEIDLQSLRPTKETFLSADEGENRLDLLYTARLRGGDEVLIYLLFEHKSSIDRQIALQLLRYVLRILDWRNRNRQPLSVVIPLVLYHGDDAWDEPTSLRDKVQASPQLRCFVPDQGVIVVDFGRMAPGFLGAYPELEARIRTLQIARRSELAYESVTGIFRLLSSWEEIHAQMDALNDIIIYLYTVFDARNLPWFEQAIRAGLQTDSEKPMPTCLEAMIEKGIEKGIERGVERGLMVGRIQTLQQVLRQSVTAEQELLGQSIEQLRALCLQLQEQLGQQQS